MPLGPGKYDRECAQARRDADAAGVVLIVMGGRHGDGFSAQLNQHLLRGLPDTLRFIADEMEAALKEGRV